MTAATFLREIQLWPSCRIAYHQEPDRQWQTAGAERQPSPFTVLHQHESRTRKDSIDRSGGGCHLSLHSRNSRHV